MCCTPLTGRNTTSFANGIWRPGFPLPPIRLRDRLRGSAAVPRTAAGLRRGHPRRAVALLLGRPGAVRRGGGGVRVCTHHDRPPWTHGRDRGACEKIFRKAGASECPRGPATRGRRL